MSLAVRAGARTDTGRVRQANQDALLATSRIFAVADGMGGHAAGEVASAIAVEVLARHDPTDLAGLGEAAQAANREIWDRAHDDRELAGMGTTLAAIALVREAGHPVLAVANVGDSRVYVLQGDRLVRISRDHSFVEDLVAAGELTAEEARTHPRRNILTRALGIDDTVEVDLWQVAAHAGDRYLLCSDGLVNEVDEVAITGVLSSRQDPQEAADVLVDLANAAGARDNVTAVVVDVVDDGLDEPVGDWLDDAGVPAVVAEPAAAEPPPERRRRRRVTWRLPAFLVVLGALAGVAIGGTAAYARNGYTVTVADDGHLIALRGQSVLWFEPPLATTYPTTLDDVPAKDEQRLRDGVHVSSRAEADAYVQRLADEHAELTGTTTTTTVAPATSTTVAPATSTTLAPATSTTLASASSTTVAPTAPSVGTGAQQPTAGRGSPAP